MDWGSLMDWQVGSPGAERRTGHRRTRGPSNSYMGSQILWSSCFFSLTLSSLPFHQATPIHQAILVLLLKPDKALQESLYG